MIDSAPNKHWQQIAPRIDEVIAKLPRKLREAVVLYFFEGKTQREVGDALGCSEEAARKRIARATEHMRKRLGSAGILLSVGALSAALLSQTPAPAAVIAESAVGQALADATIRAWRIKTGLHLSLAIVAVTAAIAFFPQSRTPQAPPQLPPLLPEPSPVEPAIAQAVESLLQQQQPDGNFPGRSTIASTALAVRALVAAGHAPDDDSAAGRALKKAQAALLAVTDFGPSMRDQAYQRALLVMALADLGEPTQKHCDRIAAAQSATGLWQDASEQGIATTLAISAWQLQALEVGGDAYSTAIARARAGLQRLSRPDAFGYSAGSRRLSPGASAVASIWGRQPLNKSGSPRAFMYHQLFHLTSAWRLLGDQDELAGMRRFILNRQGKDGSFSGDHAFDGGAYATAWAILCLSNK